MLKIVFLDVIKGKQKKFFLFQQKKTAQFSIDFQYLTLSTILKGNLNENIKTFKTREKNRYKRDNLSLAWCPYYFYSITR